MSRFHRKNSQPERFAPGFQPTFHGETGGAVLCEACEARRGGRETRQERGEAGARRSRSEARQERDEAGAIETRQERSMSGDAGVKAAKLIGGTLSLAGHALVPGCPVLS